LNVLSSWLSLRVIVVISLFFNKVLSLKKKKKRKNTNVKINHSEKFEIYP